MPDSSSSGTKSMRRHQAEIGVVPADQRLEAADPAGGKIHLRLIVQHELLLRHRLAQAALQAQALRPPAQFISGE